jgi:hypothetical protein
MNIVFAYHNGDAELAIQSALAIKAFGPNIRHNATICCQPNTSRIDEVESILKECFVNVGRIAAQDGFNGWPLGPNQMFVDAAVHCYDKNEPWYFWEPDCVPMRSGWCDLLQDEYEKNPAILGCMYDGGIAHDGRNIYKMIVGSAIYPPNVLDYCPLARNLNQYNMTYRSSGIVPDPWDVYCRWEFLKVGRNTQMIRSYWKSVNYRWEDGKIVFFASDPDAQAIQGVTCPQRIVEDNAVVVHGCKDGSLHKMAINGFAAEPAPQIQPIVTKQPKPPAKARTKKTKRTLSPEERKRRSDHMKAVAAKRWGNNNVQQQTT